MRWVGRRKRRARRAAPPPSSFRARRRRGSMRAIRGDGAEMLAGLKGGERHRPGRRGRPRRHTAAAAAMDASLSKAPRTAIVRTCRACRSRRGRRGRGGGRGTPLGRSDAPRRRPHAPSSSSRSLVVREHGGAGRCRGGKMLVVLRRRAPFPRRDVPLPGWGCGGNARLRWLR